MITCTFDLDQTDRLDDTIFLYENELGVWEPIILSGEAQEDWATPGYTVVVNKVPGGYVVTETLTVLGKPSCVMCVSMVSTELHAVGLC